MKLSEAIRAEWPDQAETIIGLIRGTVDPESFAAVQTWIRECYHRPSDQELIARALDEVLGTYGVEACFSRRSCTHPAIVYLNAGDSYATTLVYLPGSDRWKVTSWGDQVEAFERRGVYFD